MKLKFIINDNYIISHTLSYTGYEKFSSYENRPTLGNFSQIAWEKCKTCYSFFAGRLANKTMLETGPDQTIENLNHCVKHLNEYLEFLKNTPEYKELKKQVEKYKEKCEKEWKNNFPKSEKIVRKLTGFDFNKEFEIYITHPSLKNGRYWGDNKISWGNKEQWPNYTTVYLWHEILHSYFGYSQLEHAIIELITDRELKSKLNNQEYSDFNKNISREKLEKKILPKWKEYKIKGGNITKFIKKIKKSIKK